MFFKMFLTSAYEQSQKIESKIQDIWISDFPWALVTNYNQYKRSLRFTEI